MQVSSLTDNELRNLVDVQPDNLEAVREAARRFVEGSSEEADRIEQMKGEAAAMENDLKDIERTNDELKREVTRLKGLIQGARRELADA